MAGEVSFKGAPLHLVGREVKIGEQAPSFQVVSQELKKVSLADFKDTIKIVTTFPSLDTPVCDLQVKEFNKRATGLSSDVIVVGVSMDLPFAQKRFCQENGIDRVKVLSDYADASFGINYGLLIKELHLLARAILIIDKTDVVRYIQVVKEVANPPDYADAMNKLGDIIAHPVSQEGDVLPSHCKPCEGGIAPLPKDKVAKLIAAHQGWEVVEDKKLVKEIKFKDFTGSEIFLDMVSLWQKSKATIR